MRKVNDLTRQRFGRLIVIKDINKRANDGHVIWLCKCDCGNYIKVQSNSLTTDKTKSCGCSRIKHGMTKTKIYIVWAHMLGRCRNKNLKAYKDYGSRGIKVCKNWLKFENFYADMGDPPKGLTLERIDNNKGYSPNNCKWATMKEQSNNSRNNVIIEYKGLKLTMMQWAEKTGINYSTLLYRLRYYNWSIERALTFNKTLQGELTR